MKKCPFCAEEIQEEAIKCKHCSSDLSQDNDIKKEIKAKHHESYSTFTLISFLLPIVGLILGIVYLTKSNRLDKKLGEHTLSLSIVFIILWFIAILLFGNIITI